MTIERGVGFIGGSVRRVEVPRVFRPVPTLLGAVVGAQL
jgi:hypothetical protein